MKTKRILAFLFIATFMLSFSAAAVAQGETDDDFDVYYFDFQIPEPTDHKVLPMLFPAEAGKTVTLSGYWDVNVPLTITIYHNGCKHPPILLGELNPGEAVTFKTDETCTYRVVIQCNATIKAGTIITGSIKVSVPK